MEQDRLGGNLDAFTTHEETGFVMKVIDAHFAKVFNLDESLGVMLGNPGVLARLVRHGIRAALGRRRVPFGFDPNAEPPATDYSSATATAAVP